MIRRLIILLLIVGCENEEEPTGLCTFFKGTGDTLTAMSFIDSTFNLDSLFQFECKDGYTINDCCSSGVFRDTTIQFWSEEEESYNINRRLKICNESILFFGNPNYSTTAAGFSLDGLNPEYWIENEVCVDIQGLTDEDTTMSLYDSLTYNVNTEFDTSIIAFDSLIIGTWELNQVRVLNSGDSEWNISTYPNDNNNGFVQQSNRTFFIDGTVTIINYNESHTDTMQYNWLTNQNQQLILLRNDNTTYANFKYYYIDDSEDFYLVHTIYLNISIMEEKFKLLTNPL